jgi:hypothetical protein
MRFDTNGELVPEILVSRKDRRGFLEEIRYGDGFNIDTHGRPFVSGTKGHSQPEDRDFIHSPVAIRLAEISHTIYPEGGRLKIRGSRVVQARTGQTIAYLHHKDN